MCVEPHPSRHDWIDFSRVTECQSHEVGVQRSDSLKHQPDVAGGGEVEQGRGGVICTGPTIDQRRVDLQTDRQVSTDMQQQSESETNTEGASSFWQWQMVEGVRSQRDNKYKQMTEGGGRKVGMTFL